MELTKPVPSSLTQPTVPQVFDGRFFFTNPYKDDFTGRWNGTDYTFAAGTSSPLIIMDATPLEIQSIRKKFAKELGLREFYKSKAYKAMDNKKFGVTPPTYAEADIAPYIQRCLEPLPISTAKITTHAKKDPVLKTDARGKKVIKVLGAEANGSVSLEAEALEAND
jgi:hypothetical protein